MFRSKAVNFFTMSDRDSNFKAVRTGRFALGILCWILIVFIGASTPLAAQAQIIPLLEEYGLNPLGDIVPAGQSIANRKVYRQAFAELRRERSFYDYQADSLAMDTQDLEILGQHPGSPTASHTIWFNPLARAGEYASSLPVDPYDLESYGFQGGTTFFSDRERSIGIMAGYERGYFRNKYKLDSVLQDTFPNWADPSLRQEANATRFDDYYLGLYYGRVFANDLEMRAYIGGGHQRYKMSRNDQLYSYVTTYEGASFELNLEFATSVKVGQGLRLRPFIGLDIESILQESAMEAEVGKLFRYYDRSCHGKLFFRVGADLEKDWRRVNVHGGISYTCMVLGNTRPKAAVFYPGMDVPDDFVQSGARLGRSSLNLRAGSNLYVNRARTNSLFVEYTADIFLDREGDGGLHTGMAGFAMRF